MPDQFLPPGVTLGIVWPPSGVDGLPALTCGPFCEPFDLSPQSIRRAHFAVAAHCWASHHHDQAEHGRIRQEHSQ